MDIALIAPVSQLHYCVSRRYQMMLPSYEHLEVYSRYYKHFGGNDSYHVILDNGVFEEELITDHDLLELAATYKADEVVAPDTLRDATATAEQLEKFITLQQHPSRAFIHKPNLIAVVQGSTLPLCQWFVRVVASCWPEDVHTLGIPKHLPNTTNKSDARLQLLQWIQDRYPSKWDIHFLGFTTTAEAAVAARMGVRSLDTSAPFVCAGEELTLESRVPARPVHFINEPPSKYDPGLTRTNITFLDWTTRCVNLT